jgi:hypothetical protein
VRFRKVVGIGQAMGKYCEIQEGRVNSTRFFEPIRTRFPEATTFYAEGPRLPVTQRTATARIERKTGIFRQLRRSSLDRTSSDAASRLASPSLRLAWRPRSRLWRRRMPNRNSSTTWHSTRSRKSCSSGTTPLRMCF